MKKISKTFSTVLISFTAVALTITALWACAYDPDYFIDGLFNPHASRTDGYKAFYRAKYVDFFDGEKLGTAQDADSVNILSWQAFFHNGIPQKDLKELVYQYSIGQIDTLIFRLKDAKYPITKELAANAVLKGKNTRQASDFLFYLGYAKRCELFATMELAPEERDSVWALMKEKVEPLTKKKMIEYLLEGGAKQIQNTSFQFIKERYMFQIGRLLFQSGKLKECCRYFEENIGKFTADQSIKYRFMSNAAGAYYRLKDYASANYYFALAFDNAPELKKMCIISFHPQEETDFAGTLAKAKNDHEKAVIWFMAGYYEDPFRAMQQVYKLEPGNELLSVLLTRYLDVKEEVLGNEVWANNETKGDTQEKRENYYRLQGTLIPDEEMQFVKMVADNGNSEKPYLWHIAAGYFSTIKQKYSDAHKYLSLAGGAVKNDKLISDQVHLMQIFLAVEESDKIAQKEKGFVASEILWLNKPDDILRWNKEDAKKWLVGRLASKHFAQGDFVLAECLVKGFDKTFYDDYNKMSGLLQFLQKPGKSDYEKYIYSLSEMKPSDVYDYQGVLALRHENLSEAVEKFEKSAGEYAKERKAVKKGDPEGDNYITSAVDADPFMTGIREREEREWRAMDKQKKYTKLTFAKKLKELFDKAEKQPALKAKNYFAIATAYYNMTYYGNSRRLYQTNAFWYGNVFFGTKGNDKLPILDCSIAKKYYLKALAASTDAEFSARCCFMLARCEQNEYYRHVPEDYAGDFKAGEYFNILRRQYSNTQYYEEIIRECGYFRQFSGR